VSGNNTASRAITVGGADLALTKTAGNPSPRAGVAVFTIGIRNNGSSNATGISVTDLLPAGLFSLFAVETQGNYTSANGIWTVGNLVSGSTATLTLVTLVTARSARS